MKLDDALEQIAEIRSRLESRETYRGYRAATAAFSGLMAVGVAVAQAMWLPRPTDDLRGYLSLWLPSAAVVLAVTGLEMWIRLRWEPSPRTRRLTRLAVEQFLPCLAAGGVVTAAIAGAAPEVAWMLPGLWAILTGLGVYASCRVLPPATSWVGLYYLLAGTCCLLFGRGELALSPWWMAVAFGGGQLLAAAVLYDQLERRRDD